MSVTFAPEHRDSDITGWALECVCGDLSLGEHPTHEAALAAFVARGGLYGPTCPTCDAAPTPRAVSVDLPYVNMSSRNAAMILNLLGVDADTEGWAGSFTPDDLTGRVLIARALTPADAGVPSYADAAPGRATWVECGREEGYTEDRLDRIAEVAAWCAAHGREVTWA